MMNRWTNKYSYGPGGVTNTTAREVGSKLRTILLVALVIAVVLLGIFGGRAMVYSSKCEPTFIHRMTTECNEAVSSTKALSRSGGAESQAILGKIRANIHAIDVINEINNSLEGGDGYFVPVTHFTQLYGIIDSYQYNLKLGSATIEDQNDLVNALADLSSLLEALE